MTAPTNQTGVPFGTSPTAVVTAAAGSTASVTQGTNTLDQRGSLTVSSAGTGQTAGAIATVTFAKPLAAQTLPVVNLTPMNANAAGVNPFVTAVTASGFQIGVATALTAAQSYIFGYSVTP